LTPPDTGDVASMERTFTHPKTGEPTQMRTGNIGRSRAPDPEPEKGSSEQEPTQPQLALSPQLTALRSVADK
jgi:hypothetical protein